MRALEFITSHVFYNPAYIYEFQLKTTYHSLFWKNEFLPVWYFAEIYNELITCFHDFCYYESTKFFYEILFTFFYTKAVEALGTI